MKVEKEQAARAITEKEQALKDAYDNWGALEEASKVKDQKIEKLNNEMASWEFSVLTINLHPDDIPFTPDFEWPKSTPHF